MIMTAIAINWVAFFAAIVEKEDTPLNKYGITQAYLDDANEYGKTNIKMREVLTSDSLAQTIINFYLSRYGKKYMKDTGHKPTLTVLFRLHHGGPDGWKRESSGLYGEYANNLYEAIKKELEQ